jgi:hypothetical protein
VCVRPDVGADAAGEVIDRLKAMSTDPSQVESFPGGVVFVPTTLGSVREIAALAAVDWIGLPARRATIEDLIDKDDE